MQRMVFTAIVSLLVVSKTAKILGIPTDIDDDVYDFVVEDYSSKEEMELTLQPTTSDPLFEYSDNSTDQVLTLASKVSNITSTSPLPLDEEDPSADIRRLVPFIFMSAISVGIMYGAKRLFGRLKKFCFRSHKEKTGTV
ncbi:hypothetical protein TNIN_338271 [Trichonephila inaurata madagascariensis]|uniref:Uncharacterized protein n=1 Tax=Trichonephila inaurata madagascariensis TaxID=2747483 RepID=A0A8X6XPM8_9ARAC|nr:hypothetical protein TNIN_338271 [Trichonephila inaurata madagascariensis]